MCVAYSTNTATADIIHMNGCLYCIATEVFELSLARQKPNKQNIVKGYITYDVFDQQKVFAHLTRRGQTSHFFNTNRAIRFGKLLDSNRESHNTNSTFAPHLTTFNYVRKFRVQSAAFYMQ